MTSVRIRVIYLDNVRSMKAFRITLQFCPARSTYIETIVVDLQNLEMIKEFKNLLLFCPDQIPRDPLDLMLNSRPTYRDIGNEGWALLAKAVKLRPDFVTRISCCHHTLREARKEDMFVIWDVVGDVELVYEIDNVNFTRWSGHGAWRRLALVWT